MARRSLRNTILQLAWRETRQFRVKTRKVAGRGAVVVGKDYRKKKRNSQITGHTSIRPMQNYIEATRYFRRIHNKYVESEQIEEKIAIIN